MIGREVKVLFEKAGREAGQMIGKSEYLHAVYADAPATVLGQVHCTAAHIFPDSLCAPLPLGWDGSSIEVEVDCVGDSVLFILTNTGNGNMAQPLDFIGLNYYTRSIAQAPVSADEQRRGYRFVPPDPQRPDLTDIGWAICPQGLDRVVRNLVAQWPLPPIWITENGAADNAPVVKDVCDDRLRLGYLQSHLAQLSQMVASGLDIRGYYVWSLLDNFEWAQGYTQRFGVVHVDYDTQQRTPKASAHWLQTLMRDHALQSR